MVALPLLVGVGLAVTVGGWTSVVVALVCWLGLAAVLALVLRFGFRTWWPVRSLIDTAGRLSDGDYTARVQNTTSAPLRPVVDSFNRMAEHLERAESDRRRLLADVGHELRTPLTVIRGELEAMADGIHEPDEDEIRRLLGDIAVMERLLDDLRTLSTAEAGRLRIHRELVDVAELVGDVVERFRHEAESTGVTLRYDTGQTVGPVDANVDPVRVREIVGNVVANALRATEPGGRVEVSIALNDTANHVIVTVADDGHGIAADELDQVFERFHKGPDSNGSGLGLTITRNLVEAHGGQIKITSQAGEGTTVSIDLPRA